MKAFFFALAILAVFALAAGLVADWWFRNAIPDDLPEDLKDAGDGATLGDLERMRKAHQRAARKAKEE